jgi:uncharacterized protein
MPFLIDGHNLIAHTPGLSLADPDDEADLVMLLRRFTTAKRGRQATVVFDHGVYGHPYKLDGYGITCVFARSPQDADEQIIRRLRALKRPRDWTLVTSDRRVVLVAQERGVKVVGSPEFAQKLIGPAASKAPRAEEKYDVRLSEAEVEEWLRIFGERHDED